MDDMTEDQREACKALIEKAILIAGSGLKLSKKVGVTAGAVCHWKKGYAVPSGFHAAKIHKITRGKIKKEQLRPDINW